MRTYRGKEGYK